MGLLFSFLSMDSVMTILISLFGLTVILMTEEEIFP